MSTRNSPPGEGEPDDIEAWYDALTGRTASSSRPDVEAGRAVPASPPDEQAGRPGPAPPTERPADPAAQASPPHEHAAQLRRALVEAAQKEEGGEKIQHNWERLQRALLNEPHPPLKRPPKSPRNE